MVLKCDKHFFYLFVAVLCFSSKTVTALEFQTGVGVGFEYTDNVKLVSGVTEPIENDLIAIASVAATLVEDRGPLQYSGIASYSKQNYTRDSFVDQTYLNLVLDADWEMVRERFHWVLSDRFSQRSIIALNTNVPGNLQDTNVFKFGADILFPVSARQRYSLKPTYTRNYFETTSTDNEQLELVASWNYQMYRLISVGVKLGVRNINYTEENVLAITPAETTFTNVSFIINGERVTSDYTLVLGATNVERKNEREETGFSGSGLWNLEVSSRSKFKAQIFSELTDASSVSSITDGGDDDVQLVADVIRDSVFNVEYAREDVDLHSRIWIEYRRLKYDVAQVLNQVVRTTGVRLDFPGTPLFSSNISARFKQTERTETDRVDDTFVVDGGFKYSLSRKLHGAVGLQYETKESTTDGQNYNELSLLFSLVYGGGDVNRSLRGSSF